MAHRQTSGGITLVAPHKCNRGDTGLRGKRRTGNPMEAFDRLPPELRKWMTGANLPWSPTSCDKIWRKAKSRGLTIDQRLQLLDRIESATLDKANKTHS